MLPISYDLSEGNSLYLLMFSGPKHCWQLSKLYPVCAPLPFYLAFHTFSTFDRFSGASDYIIALQFDNHFVNLTAALLKRECKLFIMLTLMSKLGTLHIRSST